MTSSFTFRFRLVKLPCLRLFEVVPFAKCTDGAFDFYPNGVSSHSPGLRGFASYPGTACNYDASTPTGLCHFMSRRWRNPVGVEYRRRSIVTQGSSRSLATLGYKTQLLRSRKPRRTEALFEVAIKTEQLQNWRCGLPIRYPLFPHGGGDHWACGKGGGSQAAACQRS
jgi:hypothetical protein